MLMLIKQPLTGFNLQTRLILSPMLHYKGQVSLIVKCKPIIPILYQFGEI